MLVTSDSNSILDLSSDSNKLFLVASTASIIYLPLIRINFLSSLVAATLSN